MFDIGWSELLVIAVVLIVVVGPKDLPPMLRTFGKTMTRFRKMAGEFRAQFDDALREADLDDVRQTIADAQKLNPAHSLREAMNPLRQMGNDIKADLQRSTSVEHTADTQPAAIAAGTPSPEPAASVAVETAEAPKVIAPPPEVVSEAVTKPKPVRKPRTKQELVVTEVPAPDTVVEAIPAPKAPRKPRVKAEALVVDASVPVVTEVLSPAKPVRRSRARVEATQPSEPSVVEPAQVGLPADDKPKRAARKPAASRASTESPAGSPPSAPVTKENDA